MARSEQYASFQIYRPVQETDDLRRFLTVADEIGHSLFANSSFVHMRQSEQVVQSEDVFDTAKQSVGRNIARHEIYNRSGLKLALLDARSPRPFKTEALLRAFNRFESVPDSKFSAKRGKNQSPRTSLFPTSELVQAGLRHDIPDTSELIVTFDSLTIDYDPKQPDNGYEIALVPNPATVEARLLLDEAAICFGALAANYRELAFPTSKTSLFVAFGRTPSGPTNETEVDEFISTLKSRLPLHLILGEPTPHIASS